MKISYRAQRVETVTREIPDHYGEDKSKRGRVVDILLDGNERDDLYGDNQKTIERAIANLAEAYDKATKILCIFCEVAKP